MSELPLFPLPVVLFPDSALPLHIFEERYKILIGECVDGRREFGINLVQDGKVSRVGCTAVVKEVRKRYPDGRKDIVVVGRRRYTLGEIDSGRAPYFVGAVEFFGSVVDTVDRTLACETIQLYNALIEIVYKDQEHQQSFDQISTEPSFVLAQKAGMDVLQRQHLLELVSENDRLKVLRDYLTDIIPKLETMDEVNRVIRSDGYL